jgi:hypothetical protein
MYIRNSSSEVRETQAYYMTSDNNRYVQLLSLVMAEQADLHTLISKWTTDSEGFQADARRLERSDLSRHATSVAMLEAHHRARDRSQYGSLSAINTVHLEPVPYSAPQPPRASSLINPLCCNYGCISQCPPTK